MVDREFQGEKDRLKKCTGWHLKRKVGVTSGQTGGWKKLSLSALPFITPCEFQNFISLNKKTTGCYMSPVSPGIVTHI